LIGGRGHHKVAISWLVGTSLFFYSWWNPAYLGLMLGSILFNYAIGVVLMGHGNKISKKSLLIIGILINLTLLGYFKYSNFFVSEITWVLGYDFHLNTIILPLAISFFTFQQITYLVDTYKGETRESNFLHYCLFVTFFPQLIAGPIVHHKEMLPQFAKDIIYKLNYKNLAVGIAIFTIGIFKKVVIADGISEYSTPVFNAAENGIILSFFEAWAGAFAYTFQLYFDFSGYSDMAIGLARMFGIRLPLNFHSPYKANNIIEFWRRWHITLSRFLRDYVYIPLGGNRKGKFRRYTNVIITMLLGGLWHGAGWTFVIWGALHGLYLAINHGWHGFRRAIGHDLNRTTWLGRLVAHLLTFLAIVIGWVFFRAESYDSAMSVLTSMAGGNGISLPIMFAEKFGTLVPWLNTYEVVFNGIGPNNLANMSKFVSILPIILFIVWFAPNTQEIMSRYQPSIETVSPPSHCFIWLQWKINYRCLFINILVLAYVFWAMNTSKISEFLYFQF
jgi:alginate O-acetyltransferase complex protein AlgI